MVISKSEEMPVEVVGSSQFGRYPKIDLSKTYNMFISDSWLINYAGFKKQTDIFPSGVGRGLFNSIRGGFLLAVVGENVYVIGASLSPQLIPGALATTTGDVYIDENLDSQICIVDGVNAYIYNYENFPRRVVPQILTITPPSPLSTYILIPNYVCYHNTFFLLSSSPISPNSSSWYAFEPNPSDSTMIQMYNPGMGGGQFLLQTKPDVALAVERLPGKGNNVIVWGYAVAEIWTQVAGNDNYRRVQSFNIDSGVVSVSTIAASEEWVCWLSQNENLDLSIMMTNGSDVERISTDGIDYVLSQIIYPTQSNAFFYRIGGHLFYQITFSNPADNLTLIYDFATKLFFHISDQNLNFHPARQIVFYIDKTYFVSLNDGSLYWMDTNLLTYDYSESPDSIGDEIPRIRICKSIRRKNSERFRAGEFTFWIEQGVVPQNAPTPARVDMSVSKNGGQSFGSVVSKQLNSAGNYRNQIRWWRMGQANEFIIQLRFYGFQRFVVNNGYLQIY